MNSEYDIVVIGNAGIDTNVYPHENQISLQGEGYFSENRDYVGQAGGYGARGAARLGYRVAYIGALGDDPMGEWIRQEFQADGIDCQGIFEDPQGTARSVNFMKAEGTRTNFYDGRGHMEGQPDLQLCRKIMSGTRLCHFNIPNWARELLPLLKEEKAIISCDLQDVRNFDDPYRKDFIEASHLLFFSAAHLTNPIDVLLELTAKFPQKYLVCGMGSQGVSMALDGRVHKQEPPNLPWQIVDSNGAGDALALGFSTSLVLEGMTIEASLLRGQIAARWTCTQRGSSEDLICRSELDTWFRRLKRD